MEYSIEFEQEDDGRWIADLPVIAGVMAYGDSIDAAKLKVEVLALSVMEDRRQPPSPSAS